MCGPAKGLGYCAFGLKDFLSGGRGWGVEKEPKLNQLSAFPVV